MRLLLFMLLLAATSSAEDSEILESKVETYVYTRFKDMHQEVIKFSNKGKYRNWRLIVQKECIEQKEKAIELLNSTAASLYLLSDCFLKKEEGYYSLFPREEEEEE